jgi:diadenosine tetraphosphate (Ap4A) HIT family hydrolase
MMCDFCNELAGQKPNTFSQLYNAVLESRTLLRTQNFVVLPTIGQVVGGYLLVVPTKHYLAIAEMPIEALVELANIKAVLRTVLKSSYDSPIFFEHGVSRHSESGGCGISHAHLHVVPLANDLTLQPFIYAEYGEGCEIKEAQQLQDWSGEPYIFYEGYDNQQLIFKVSHVPSQYLRRGIAKLVGSDKWDWRGYGLEQQLISTYHCLKPNLTSSFSDIRVA